MPDIKYACLLVDTRDKESEKITDRLIGTWGFKLCRDAYRTEMSCMTGEPEETFHVDPGYTVITVTEDEKCLGFVSLYVDIEARTIIVGHAYVRPEVREKGVYRMMVKRIEKFAKDIKMDKIVAFVYRANGGSMKAHSKIGFKQNMVGYTKEVK